MKYDYDDDLRKKTHQLDKEFRISKVSTVGTNSIHQNKQSISSSRFKRYKNSSLQSYVPTNENNNETVTSEGGETEDRLMRTTEYVRKNNKYNSDTFIQENFKVKSPF